MAETYSNLSALFIDIADAIRNKTGSTEPITADAFPTAIDAIPSGGDNSLAYSLIERTLTEISGSNTSIGPGAFAYCFSLTSVSFPVCTYIGSYAFRYCYNLISLTLGGSTVCSLPYSNAFTPTPIGGYSTSAGRYGSIYVPASLLASYKAATNWSYFSSRFVGY